MGGVADKQVDARKVWGVAVVVGVLAVWQWPHALGLKQTLDHNAKTVADQDDLRRRGEEQVRGRRDALLARERAVGIRGVLNDLMAKKLLTSDEETDLSEAFSDYTSCLQNAVAYNDAGAPTFKGPNAKFLEKVDDRIRNPDSSRQLTKTEIAKINAFYSGKSSDSVGQDPQGSSAASGGAWHTVAHFTGRGMKDTPRFAVGAEEWRIRWKAKGSGILRNGSAGCRELPGRAPERSSTLVRRFLRLHLRADSKSPRAARLRLLDRW